MLATFTDWTAGRAIATLGTNHGSQILPFQNWRHFKEAFAPELVARAVDQCGRQVRRCVDPFGGSGTTALACQFLGVEPVTIEVSPFLADLISTKLTTYDCDKLARELGTIVSCSKNYNVNVDAFFSTLLLIVTFNNLKTGQKSHKQVPVVRKRLPTKMRQPEVFLTQVVL